MITFIGYLLSLLMGLTLGLMGAGGSILTVPILVYFFHVKPVIATGYSLLVVGSTATLGAGNYWRQGKVSISNALIFALPAMLMVITTRRFIVPALPDPVFFNPFALSKDMFIMLLFSVLMLAAAFYMFKPIALNLKKTPKKSLWLGLKLIFGSACIGLLTGLVGAGGGFLIIPTLIGLFGLEMKEAIGTSLAIIAINSLVGFNGDLLSGIPLDGRLLGSILLLTLLGMLLGMTLNAHVNAQKLKKLFALFTLTIGLIIMLYEMQLMFNL